MNKQFKELSVLILAAGKGTRMKSNLPKVMHKVANREMLNMVIDEAKSLSPKNITIVVSEEMQNFQDNIIKEHTEVKISFIIQKERKGTAHAVLIGLEKLENLGDKLLILYGDTPLISSITLQKMVEKLEKVPLCILGFKDKSVNSYGRLITDKEGQLKKIVEFKDATTEEKEITLCNSGVISVDGKEIKNLLNKVENQNAAGEFYLTDIVGVAYQVGLKCAFIKTQKEEVLGVNSRLELSKVEAIKQNQIRNKMLKNGVTMVDPTSVYFAFDTQIANDVIIHPQVVFGLRVKIDQNAEIKSFCHIEGAEISENVVVGPFARIRPETIIGKNSRIGNFVEIKKSNIEANGKVNHLSYIGDTDVGQNTNIGAGTITCNYDGYNKFRTKIGKNVFIGSNSALVAPLEIGDEVVIGAGSVITKNVDDGDLAVSRSKQIVFTEGGKSYHERKAK